MIRERAKSLPRPLRQAKSPRPFVILAIASPVTCLVAFFLMQLAFGVGTLWSEIVGFAFFTIFVASAVATIVGVIGAIVRIVGPRRDG